jgi:Domain of unknown function (DUF5615)
MKFIVDAQLPRHLAYFLQNTGYDTLHTLDLPLQNTTPDSNINQLSIAQEPSSSPKMPTSLTPSSPFGNPTNSYSSAPATLKTQN